MTAARSLKDKVLRLLVPWLVGTLTHTSRQVCLERLAHGQFSGSYIHSLPHYFAGVYEDMHLWYLQIWHQVPGVWHTLPEIRQRSCAALV